MGKIVECDACKGRIEVSDKIIRNRMSGDVLFTFFQCPHCETAFLISATDKEFRKTLAKRARGMRRHRNIRYMDQEAIRRLSEEQKQKYTPRFRELVPTAFGGMQK